MAGLSITDLPMPPDEWRPDLHALGFEPEAFATEEDAGRAMMLRKFAKGREGKRRARLLALADLLDPEVTPEIPNTPASARFLRHQRIRIIGWVWKAVAEDLTGDVARFDVIKPCWAVDRKGLRRRQPNQLCEEFRADLNRVAAKVKPEGASGCRGFLFAVLHGEHEIQSKLFQLHFHVIATGDWVTVVEGLKNMKAYKPTQRVIRPVRARRKLKDLAYALTYLIKLYWPGKWCGNVSGQKNVRRRRQHGRITEPYHSDVLLWLDQWRLGDLIVMRNLKPGKDGLIIKSVFE